nr:hypothetical protein [Tanacetum cinerariifolium]
MLVSEQLSQGEGPTSPVRTQHTPTIIETSPQLQNIYNTYRKTRTKTRRIGIRVPQSNVSSSVADEAITKEMHDGLVRATTNASSLEAEQGSGSISKTQTKETLTGLSSLGTSSKGGLECHVTMGVVMFRLGLKGYLTCPINHHSEKVIALVNKLKSKKAIYNKAFITLTKRVKKLEKNIKHKRRRAVVDSLEDKEASLDKEDSSKQGRLIEEIDEDKNVNLVKSSKQWEAHETAGRRKKSDDTDVVDFSTARPQKDDDEITLAETLVNIKKSAGKYKGKAIMQEYEPPKKIKKKKMIQISLDEENAQRFYEEEQAHLLMDEEYAQKSSSLMAQIQANEDLAQRMLEEERESMYIEERSILLTEFIEQRKNLLAAKRAKEKRNKPPTQAQQRTYINNYIKNMGGYTLKQLKKYSFQEIKMLFDRTIESIRKFVPMESEGQIADSKVGEGSSKEGESLKRPAEEELGQEQQKKQKVKEDLSQERLQQMMVIIPEQGIHVEAL